MARFLILLMFMPSLAGAKITIQDFISPLIAKYDQKPPSTWAEKRVLILEHEWALSREFGDLYYDRLSYRQKIDALRQFDDYAADLSELIAKYRARLPKLKEILIDAEGRLAKELGLHVDCPAYLWTSLAPTDGKVTFFDGKQGFSLNLRVVVQYDDDALRVLLAHELFHLAQGKLQERQDEGHVLLQAMFSEGFATFASSLVYPGLPEWKYVSYFATDGTQYRTFQSLDNELRAEFAKALSAPGVEGQRMRFFSANAEQARPWPPRAGYYLGYRFAQELAKTRGGKTVALMMFSEFSDLVNTWLSPGVR